MAGQYPVHVCRSSHEAGDESVVGDDGLVAALGHDGQLLQVLKQLLVIADWQDDSGAVAVLVRKILQGLAHGVRLGDFVSALIGVERLGCDLRGKSYYASVV